MLLCCDLRKVETENGRVRWTRSPDQGTQQEVQCWTGNLLPHPQQVLPFGNAYVPTISHLPMAFFCSLCFCDWMRLWTTRLFVVTQMPLWCAQWQEHVPSFPIGSVFRRSQNLWYAESVADQSWTSSFYRRVCRRWSFRCTGTRWNRRRFEGQDSTRVGRLPKCHISH